MNKPRRRKIISATLLSFLPIAVIAQDEPIREYQLSLSPKRCISMHKGQQCFQKVTVTWVTPEQGEFCLSVNSQEAPLLCWQGRESETFRYTFNGNESLSFQVKEMASGDIVASSLFEVAWVYRSNRSRNSAWRLF